MYFRVENILKDCNYKLSYFKKILTRNKIKNHFILTIEDIKKIYENEKVTTQKGYELKIYLEEIITKHLNNLG